MYPLFIGFGLAVSWMWLFYIQVTPFAYLWRINPEDWFHWFMGANFLAYFVLSQGIKLRSLLDKKRVLSVCAVVLSLCPLLIVALPHALPLWSAANSWTAKMLAATGGVAFAPFLTAWNETCVLFDFQRLGLSFALAITIAGALTTLGGIVSHLGLPLMVLSPIVSLMLLLRRINSLHFQFSDDNQKTDTVNPFPAKLITLIAIFYIAGGIIYKIVSLEPTFSVAFQQSTAFYVLVCLLAGIILYCYPVIDLRFLYRPILPLLAIGFLLFSFYEGSLTLVSFVFQKSGFALFEIYTWLLYIYFARFSTRPASVCAFGLFLTSFSIFFGNQFVTVLTSMITDNPNAKTLAFVGGVLSVLSSLIFQDEKETFAGWQAVLVPDVEQQQQPILQSPFDAKPNDLLQDQIETPELTEREHEVLALLLRGRSGRFISEALNISTNTVKTHTRHIYEKLSVNNRQQLLSLLENAEQSNDL